MITVLRAGPLTTVQDRGRAGFAHLGVPRSGALDGVASRLANGLVGNSADAAVLETTLMGCSLRFEFAAWVAVAGAEAVVRVDKQPVSGAAAIEVAAGAVLDVGRARRGVRSYVAVAGGFDVEAVLGSRSTDTLSGLGPPKLADGMTLRIGHDFAAGNESAPPDLAAGGESSASDLAAGHEAAALDLGAGRVPSAPDAAAGGEARASALAARREVRSPDPAAGREARLSDLAAGREVRSPDPAAGREARLSDLAAGHGPPPPGWVGPREAAGYDSFSGLSTGELVLEVRLGPRDDWFVAGELFASAYEITPLSNRVGCRLAGSALTRTKAGELPSEGVVLGAVQVPADGQPLIFLADHPTTGGYPVIGVVEDVTPLAQARPGTTVRFRAID